MFAVDTSVGMCLCLWNYLAAFDPLLVVLLLGICPICRAMEVIMKMFQTAYEKYGISSD